MEKAFFFALKQLSNPHIWRVIIKTVLLTLILFILFGIALWQGLDRWDGDMFQGYSVDFTFFIAVIITIAAGWFLFRAVAMFVMGIFSDEVVEIVEAKYYPHANAKAQKVSFMHGLRLGLASAGRAIGYNVLASPLYVVLLITGVGLIVALVLVNGLLLGRDLQDMVMARHIHDHEMTPLPKTTRFALGLIVALLFLVPVANLLAPVVGAAMAVYLMHQRKAATNASGRMTA